MVRRTSRHVLTLRAPRARVAKTGLVAALLVASGSPAAKAQTVVPVHEEPRHRLVFQSDDLQVLDIGFQPGDTTLFHTHDRPIAYVEIDATVVNQQRIGGSWGRVSGAAAAPQRPPGRVSWNEEYADSPVTHRVTAIGPGPFRLIGVVNRGPGNETAQRNGLGPSTEPDASSRYFSRLSHRLPSSGSLDWANGPDPVVLVVASESAITLSGPSRGTGDVQGSAPRRLHGPGAFAVLEGGTTYRITNTGDGIAILAFVEVR